MFFDVAALDKFNRTMAVVIISFILVVILAPFFIFEIFLQRPVKEIWWFLLMPLPFFGLVLLFAYGFSPSVYELTETELIVRRRIFGRKYYQLKDFTAVKDATKDFKPLVQKSGGGGSGFFGYFGRFRNKKWGKYEAQATNKNKAVVLLGKTPLVVSPSEPEFFTEMAEAYIKKLHRTR